MHNIFSWLNDQLLRMQWLADLVTWFLQDLLALDIQSRLGGSVHFFLYDTIKIFILLSVLIFSISYIQSYFPPERTRDILGKHKGIGANIMGALLGTITPFCSCSSIPLFIGFSSAGLPLGVTFSFLISSPLVDLASVILLASIFNWTIAFSYVLIGIVLAVIGGTLISMLKLEKQVESFVYDNPVASTVGESLPTIKVRLQYAKSQLMDIIHRVWLYILIGVGIGALIHNWIPQAWVTKLLGDQHWWSVIVAIFAGIPMYADIFGTLPIAEALVAKGVGLGTALAFMMAVTSLSLPAMVMLKRVIKMPLLITFILIVTVGIMVMGYLFNSIAHILI